jgi:hypothetical protein
MERIQLPAALALLLGTDLAGSLAGNLGSFRPGDRVTVRGRIADVSTCMQGPTLTVQRINKAE